MFYEPRRYQIQPCRRDEWVQHLRHGIVTLASRLRPIIVSCER